MRKTILLLTVCLLLSACSGGSGSSDTSGPSNANLSLTVFNSRSFNPDVIHGQIDRYRVSISGDDMEDPLEKDFDGATQKARLLNVPVGANRTITVEALNPNGVVIRRGKKEGITIAAGQLSHVDLVMNSVPIFTNLSDKSAVAGTRVGFHIFGEPGSKLAVSELQGEKRSILVDEASNKALVDTSPADGLFALDPRDFNLGVHSFEVRDENSGEASAVTVNLYKQMRPGIAVNAGGKVRQNGDETMMSGAGQSFYRRAHGPKGDLGNQTLWDVVETMF